MQERDNKSLNSSVLEVVIAHLQEMRYGTGSEAPPRQKRRWVDVEPGNNCAIKLCFVCCY